MWNILPVGSDGAARRQDVCPRHCTSDLDCRRWSFDVRSWGDLEELEHRELHVDLRDAERASIDWLRATSAATRNWKGFASAALPHPSDTSRHYLTGLVDPGSCTLMVAEGRIGSMHAKGLYIGLTAQLPSAGWIGLSGFFLPWCLQCDPDGDRLIDERLPRLLEGLGGQRLLLGELPSGLAPRDGWFNERFLVAYRLHNDNLRYGEWRHWPPDEPERPLLVRTGAAIGSASSIVYVERPAEIPALLELLDVSGRDVHSWTWRSGDRHELSALLDASEQQVHVAERGLPRSPTWASVRRGDRLGDVVVAPTRDWHMVRRRLGPGSPNRPPSRINYLKGSGIVGLEALKRL